MAEKHISYPERSRVIDTLAAKQPEVFGVKEVPRKQRSPQEVATLKRQIGLIARVFSRNYKMDVMPAAGGGWSCGIRPEYVGMIGEYLQGGRQSLDELPPDALIPKRINYDLKDVEGGMTDDEVLGVMRHEIGHANNTDYRLFFEGQRFALDQGRLPSSWAGIFNALEDPWVNNKEIAGSQVVKEKMAALYEQWERDVTAKINTQPVTQQLGLNIIHYWLKGEQIPTLTNQAVRNAFDQIQAAVDRYFAANTAAETHDILKHDIWPVFQQFEDEALKDEQQKELIRKMTGSKLGSSQNGQSGGQSSEGGILDRLRQRFGFGKPSKTEGPEPFKSAGSDELRRQLKEALKSQENRAKNGPTSSSDETLPDDIDLGNIPQELLDELQQAIDGLSNEEKQQLADSARKELDEKQSQAANKQLPKTIQLRKDPKTGEYLPTIETSDEQAQQRTDRMVEQYLNEQDQQAAKEQAVAQAAEQQRLAEQAAERKRLAQQQQMAKDGFDTRERELYQRFKSLEGAMETQIRNFMRAMDAYLPKKEDVLYGGEYYSGPKLNERATVRRAPLGDFRIHQRREVIESSEPRLFVTLLIDNSGSMAGQRMEESLKTAIFLARVLQRFNIPFAIKFFGSEVASIMRFADDYDDPKKKIKPRLMRAADASGGGTDIASPLVETIEEMSIERRKRPDSHGAIFVISDSGANAGPMQGSELGAYIQDKQLRHTIMNFLLSGHTGDIVAASELFGERNVVVADDFAKLPEQAFAMLRVTMQRVLKTLRSIG